jgi:hypothetical protein
MTKGPGSRLGGSLLLDLTRPRRRGNPGFGEMWERINAIIEGEEGGES